LPAWSRMGSVCFTEAEAFASFAAL
jgi:hypothetical protein